MFDILTAALARSASSLAARRLSVCTYNGRIYIGIYIHLTNYTTPFPAAFFIGNDKRQISQLEIRGFNLIFL